MAFDLGQRVTSRFLGTGTVVGELHRDDDRACIQRIAFDNPLIGEKEYEIRKLDLVSEERAKVEVSGGA